MEINMYLITNILNNYYQSKQKMNMENLHHVFLISSGVETKEAEFKLYSGVGICKVLAVNPDKNKLQELNMRVPEELSYTGKSTVRVGESEKEVNQARITFIIETVPDKNDEVKIKQQLTFFLNEQYRTNRDESKLQVIDKYGRTAWVTKDEFKAKAIPQYKNGPANLDKDYRPCYIGEEALTNFIKVYLGIPSVEKWQDRKVVGLIDDPKTAECRLDNIASYFKGDFSEITAIPTYQPENMIRVLFGVRNTDNGTFQTVYPNVVLGINNKNYTKFSDDVNNRKDHGGLATTEFTYTDLHEYKAPTDFNNVNSSTETTGETGSEDSDSDLPW